MKRFKIEIPIILITLIILSMLALSGKQVYESLSEIVNSMLVGTRPDHKLMLAKEVTADLNELENAVKLYTLSENRTYLTTYSEINNTIEANLAEFDNYNLQDSSAVHTPDSLIILSNQKMAIWKNVLNLYFSRQDEHNAFSEYSEKLDTMMVVQDTIYYPEEEKVGFFKRVFGKKQEPPAPLIVDRTEEKQSMQQEIARLEQEISDRNKQISAREAAYMRKNQEVNEALTKYIAKLELQEKEKLIAKTEDADKLATETFERLALFALAVILLLILVLFLFFRDMRKSRKYQKVLRNAKTEAENLARTKEIFAATVSHEMRTPVNAIYGLTEQLLQQQHDTKTQKDLEIVHKSTRHLIDLVNDTFDFTRIENQRLQLQAGHFLLSELIDEVEINNKANAGKKQIAFNISKEFNENLVLYSDESRLKQILNNLLTNAIKFTDYGSVKLIVSSKSNEDLEELQFVISDTGPGISADNQELIFKDFVQLDTDINKKAGGTGLGLYIVKKLVELLDGEISINSKPGAGTTFTVSVPVKKGDASKIQKTIQSFDAPEALHGEKVLIVDDEEFNLHLLRNILGKWKISFDEAENGQKAVDLAGQTQYALILMDIRMPVLTGTEAAQILKANGNPAKIIGLSANTNQQEVENYLENDFDNYLIKPFEEAGLHRVITETLGDQTKPKEKVEQQTTGSTVDLSDLKKMANGDPGFVKEMIDIFLKSSQKSMVAIEEKIGEEDWPAVADLAHKLAAPTKHLNATNAYKTIKQLQDLAEKDSESTLIEKNFEQLKIEMEMLSNQLQFLLEQGLDTL